MMIQVNCHGTDRHRWRTPPEHRQYHRNGTASVLRYLASDLILTTLPYNLACTANSNPPTSTTADSGSTCSTCSTVPSPRTPAASRLRLPRRTLTLPAPPAPPAPSAPPSRAPVRLPGLSTVPPRLVIYSNRVRLEPNLLLTRLPVRDAAYSEPVESLPVEDIV